MPSCPICFEETTNPHFCVPCRHVFCYDCISAWRSGTCPLCRENITTFKPIQLAHTSFNACRYITPGSEITKRSVRSGDTRNSQRNGSLQTDMSKASRKLLATGAVMALVVVLLYTSGQQQPEVNNNQTIQLHQHPDSSSQNFFSEQQKEQQIRAKVAPWSHDLTSWRQNTTLCSHPEVDTPSVLKTPGGPVKMSVYDPRKDIWVSRKIVNDGDFDGNKRQLVYSLLERDPDINFIDVGCNIGVYSLTMAKLGRKVLCVDALYMNVEHVCSSIVQNNFENSITIVMNALSNDRKYVELGVDDKNYGGTFVDEDAGDVKKKKGRTVTGGHYTSIPSVMMDDLLQLPIINMFKKSFIKMDIEGFEWKALQGASAFFSAVDVRGVFMEWIFHKGKDSGVKITEFMVRHNLYPHAQVTLTTYRPLDVSLWGNWHFMDILWLKK